MNDHYFYYTICYFKSGKWYWVLCYAETKEEAEAQGLEEVRNRFPRRKVERVETVNAKDHMRDPSIWQPPPPTTTKDQKEQMAPLSQQIKDQEAK